jgi:hypothetical protein
VELGDLIARVEDLERRLAAAAAGLGATRDVGSDGGGGAEDPRTPDASATA